MSRILDRPKAIESFKQFIAERRASKARHVNIVDEDPPFVESMEVERDEALNVFFKLHPEHAEYRAAVTQVFEGERMFSFSKKDWEETTRALTAAKPK